MSEVWYCVPRRAKANTYEPVEVEVERSTDKFLIMRNGRRFAKRNDFQWCFSNKYEAQEHILNSLLVQIDRATGRAESAKREAEMYSKQLDRLAREWGIAVGMEGVK